MPLLFSVILLDLIGFGIVIPILPFLSPQLGADKIDIALILVSYAVFAGLVGPAWGRLSDRIGRKPVIMICLAGAAVSYVMLGLATELWMVFVARAFAGAMAGNIGVATAMIGDITRPENRARGMGMIGAAFGLGMVLGPLLGGLLAGDSGSFTLPCLVAGAMSVAAIIAAAIFLPESLSAKHTADNRAQQAAGDQGSIWQMLRQTNNRLLTLQYVFHNAGVSSISYIYPLWAADVLGWTAREVGYIFAIQGMMMVFLQVVVLGPAVRYLGEINLLRIGIGTFLCGLLIAVFANTLPVIVGSMFLAMSGATLCMPVLNSITTHRTPASLRGRMMGTTGAAASWGRVFGPLLAGANLALFGYSAAWVGCAVIVSFYLAWAVKERSV
ncbi:MAG: MFS transporter [Halioglobus sp.]